MSYVTDHLLPGETVVHLGKVHWVVFMRSVFWLLLGLMVATSPPLVPAGLVLMVVALISFVHALIYKLSTELAVTTQRVIAKTRRNTLELNHTQVERFEVDRSIIGRLFGFGTVTVCGQGGDRTPVKDIADPLRFRSIVPN